MLLLGVSLFLFAGITLNAFKQRKNQKVSITKAFFVAVANYVRDWTVAKGHLPETLEETNDGTPWNDGCGKPIVYKIDDMQSLKFTLESDCGELIQSMHFQIRGTNIFVL
jgi:hypothetical protein